MAGLLARLKYLLTGQLGRHVDAPPTHMRARIDAAQTTEENRRHWANADSLSADAAYDPAVRLRLRNRARYETINNCYAKGIVRASADDLIGTGPRLQLSLPGESAGDVARMIERNFAAWAKATRLALKLRTAQKSRVRDGECFALFDTDERLANPVKFTLRWVEAEMCASPFGLDPSDPLLIDGIRFDRLGNPIEYFFYDQHPGNQLSGFSLRSQAVAAEHVLHWFALDRFGQHRAIPEITPALPLYSQQRRWTLAALTAAEFAAMLAGVMKTNQAPDDGNVTTVTDWSLWELVRGALLTLPQGWEATQFDSKNPPAAYAEFKRELLNECGRATNQPLNVVSGNSSGYNFSSGRLDHLPMQRGIRIERNDLRMLVLDPILERGWYPEAVLAGQIPVNAPPIAEWRWTWNWDGFDSIDQNKDATADDTRIKNGTSTYAEILAEYGQDWMEVFEELAREKAYAESLGLPWPVLAGGGNGQGQAQQPQQPQQPGSLEQVVQFACEEAGISEDVARDLLDALGPTFAAMRQGAPIPAVNGRSGHKSNGHASASPPNE